ncbi:MAG: hypothetical protein COB46_08160 [Rhodospirillaceae bacterium]|nr:MAG: hypothetical protein COB46_08160 [Rhodospirillaceae bacterium]
MGLHQQIGSINRVDDLNTLQAFFSNASSPISAIILYGRPGIGKSYISNSMTKRFPEHLLLEIPLSDSSSSSLTGSAQRTLGKFINEAATDKQASFTSFSNWLPSYSDPGLLNKLLNAVRKDIQIQVRRLLPGANELVNRLSGVGDYAADEIFGASDNTGVILSGEYVLEALKEKPAFIQIRNAQSLDQDSCDFIEKLMSRNFDHKFIFEFTGDVPNDRLRNVESIFGKRVEIMPVGQMDFHEFIETFKKLEIGSDVIESGRQQYSQNNGNISDMLYHVDYKRSQKKSGGILTAKKDEPKGTRAVLSTVNKEGKFILALMALHGGDIYRARLDIILKNSDLLQMTSIKKELRALDDLKLINGYHVNVVNFHDDVTRHVLNWDQYQSIRLLAAREMISFFEKTFDEKSNVKCNEMEAIGRLIYLYALTGDDEGLRSSLVELDRKPARFHRIEDAKRTLAPIKKIMSSRPNDELLHLRAGYCSTAFNCRLYEEALDVVKTLPQNEPSVRLMRAAVLSHLGQHEKAILFCNELIQDDYISSSIRVRAYIISIYACRRSGQFSNAYTLFYQGKYMEFTDPLDKALLYRTAEVVHRSDLSLPYQEEAIRLIDEHGDNLLKGFVRIDYGMQLGRLGCNDKAREELVKASDFLDDAPTQRYATENNLAVLNLNEGIYDQKTISMLNFTLMNASVAFDALAAELNLMITHTLGSNKEKAIWYMEAISERIDKWSNPDKSLLALVSQNLVWSANVFELKSKVAEYTKMQKHDGIVSHIQWKREKFGPIPAKYNPPKNTYRPCWLSPWHFPMHITLQEQ